MIWLISQMWTLLFLAFAVGIFGGFWIAHRRMGPDAHSRPNAEATGSLAFDGPARAPQLLPSPVHGPKDDLKQIIGLDPETEERLNALGVFYFRQIAEWGPGRVRWVDEKLALKGRIGHERWVEQARSFYK
ncbi:MAG TPA: hypothetical protein PLV61_09995 [Parvularculaceae bacterium]|nr:hypothetical protein [Amphiplicatus sp.]MCB9955437.1 hypothetical protein [Caulobacterales bacterium]HPE31516.1 hypothetical protein [Parvularculaceae bacterium]HRX39465.1 hypothetical protein [Parvularculaceae bacterium]